MNNYTPCLVIIVTQKKVCPMIVVRNLIGDCNLCISDWRRMLWECENNRMP